MDNTVKVDRIRYTCYSCGEVWYRNIGNTHPSKDARCAKCRTIAAYGYTSKRRES